VDWQVVRAHQPVGLSLELHLPKTTFFLGETIPAELVFLNKSQRVHHLWTGNYDRSGRIQDIAFYATDASGVFQPDPLKWYLLRASVGGGLGNEQDLGEWKIALPVNEWVRFTKPGRYSVFAYSSRVKSGDQFERNSQTKPLIELVSDPVTIRIEPLSPEVERQQLATAQRELAGKDAVVRERAIQTLRFLGTDGARAMLLPLLNGEPSFAAMTAFLMAPDPKTEAPRILRAVRDGELDVSHADFLYRMLKTANWDMLAAAELPKAAQEKFAREYREADAAAGAEIRHAAEQAAGGKGPKYNELLLRMLLQDVPRRPEAREKLVTVQLELTPEQQERLLAAWDICKGADFLPLLHKAVAGPQPSSQALEALAALRPDEAQTLIVEDIQRERARFSEGALLSLPAQPIPELDAFLRRQLAADAPNFRIIERYGDGNLLPEVVRVYQLHEGSWACDLQNAALRFWIRHAPQDGVAALGRALKLRTTECYKEVLSKVLLPEWTELARPIVVAALDDPDPDVVASAITVLDKHPGQQAVEPLIQAAERLSKTANRENLRAYYATQEIASLLLQSKTWSPNSTQRKRLEHLRANHP
jgi:hypothetical protein